jgi:two-component system OmpR family response regulator
MNRHILIVDDDAEIRTLTSRYLTQQGFRTSVAANCAQCERSLADLKPDLLVLDVMLPDGSGLNLCRSLRDRGDQVPVILLTALKEDVDRIIGLEIGADDYMVKPFVPRELIARINAVLRRAKYTEADSDTVEYYRFDIYIVEPKRRRLTTRDGDVVDLTGAEFDLLQVFLDRPGRLLSRDQLSEFTQGRQCDPFNRSIDVLISRLRKKLSANTTETLFRTVRNGGYQLAVSVEIDRAIA